MPLMSERLKKIFNMVLITNIAEAKIRMERGVALVSSLKNAIFVSAGLKIIFETSVAWSIIAVLITLISFYVVGAFDLGKLKLYQKENELNCSKYNPHLNKINRLTE